jgi:hypothetical protein
MAIPTIKQITEALLGGPLSSSSAPKAGPGIRKMAEWLDSVADKKDMSEPDEARWYFFGDKLDTGDGRPDLSSSEIGTYEAVATVTITDGAEEADVVVNPTSGDPEQYLTTSSLHELQAFLSQFAEL